MNEKLRQTYNNYLSMSISVSKMGARVFLLEDINLITWDKQPEASFTDMVKF